MAEYSKLCLGWRIVTQAFISLLEIDVETGAPAQKCAPVTFTRLAAAAEDIKARLAGAIIPDTGATCRLAGLRPQAGDHGSENRS